MNTYQKPNKINTRGLVVQVYNRPPYIGGIQIVNKVSRRVYDVRKRYVQARFDFVGYRRCNQMSF